MLLQQFCFAVIVVVASADCANYRKVSGAECAEAKPVDQALILYDEDTNDVTVVQPNEDGSYWRKIVRNKMIRMKEKRRLQVRNSAQFCAMFGAILRNLPHA